MSYIGEWCCLASERFLSEMVCRILPTGAIFVRAEASGWEGAPTCVPYRRSRVGDGPMGWIYRGERRLPSYHSTHSERSLGELVVDDSVLFSLSRCM